MRSIGCSVLLLALALGCGGGLSPVRPTETVRVLGPSTDALGRTVETDGRGFVHVELHEGPSVWVEPTRVSPASLAVGTPVVFRDASGVLVRGTVTESLDRVLAITTEDRRAILVSLDRIVAVLHAPIVTATAVAPDEVVVTQPPPPPPPDVRRYALLGTRVELLERVHLASCTGATARVLGDDGQITTMPSRDLRAMRAQVGDRVHALWQHGSTAYVGTVLAVEGRLSRIGYEDGSEEWIEPSQLVRREATTSGNGGCPRSGDEAMVRRGTLQRVVEVVSCSGATAVIHAPGDEPVAQVALSDLHALAAASGLRVEVFWHQSAPYVGWTGAMHESSVEVRYDDGSVEPAPLTDLRWIATDVVGEAYACVN